MCLVRPRKHLLHFSHRDNLPSGMLLSYAALSFRFQTLVQWHVTFVHFWFLQFSDPGNVACYFLTLLYPAGFKHWSTGMLLPYTSVSFRFQTLVEWHVTFVHFCILQVSKTGPMACYFCTLLYPAGSKHWSSGMLLPYTSVPCRFQKLVHWHVIFVHFCTLEDSHTGPVACYFRPLLYPSGFRHLPSCVTFPYTAVSPWYQLLIPWYYFPIVPYRQVFVQ